MDDGNKDVKGVYLNGKAIEPKQLPERIAVRKGLNRLVVHYVAAGGQRLVSVSRGTNPNLPVTFVRR
ncbi:MAG: hypothetical protein ACOX6W_02580 [Lentisphaeria bacterium]|jgi:hypothetical protein|nr:hypothetical protein [Treponema sp.]